MAAGYIIYIYTVYIYLCVITVVLIVVVVVLFGFLRFLIGVTKSKLAAPSSVKANELNPELYT